MVAADIEATSGKGPDFAAWAARRKGKKKGGEKRKEDGDARKSRNKGKGDGQIGNRYNRRTGIRNR